MNRRKLIKTVAGSGALLAMGASPALAQNKTSRIPVDLSHRKIPKIKITKLDTIMTGRDVYVRIETDAGIVGYGDATNHFLPYSVEGMLKDLAPYVIGEDPQRIEYLWQSCFRRRFQRGGPSTGSAIAGIDQALWDIKGKIAGMPVYQLLGGLARTSVRVYGHVSGMTAEEAANNARERASRGITCIRFRAFHSHDANDFHDHKTAVYQQIEYLEAIREAVGEDVDLILEVHGRYDPEWAIKLFELAKPFRPFFIEDPIRHENPKALKWLREHTDQPLAIGERYHDKWDCRETIENQWVNYLRPDVNHCGGISEMKKIAAMAEVYYINLVPHNNAGPLGSAATLHAALAIPNVTMMEAGWVNGPQDPKVVKPFPTVKDGYALPLEGNGLGISFDEAAAARIPFGKVPMQPYLKAIDGSVRDF
ncbi:MAG: mandelate racemase/muconate lactonizing enzyme family protein [Verrucomicrobia bacterium]|nr:mandelate racemase/muconate lactonizing enzyme family protein [Verrucomicrobiota bacterium]